MFGDARRGFNAVNIAVDADIHQNDVRRIGFNRFQGIDTGTMDRCPVIAEPGKLLTQMQCDDPFIFDNHHMDRLAHGDHQSFIVKRIVMRVGLRVCISRVPPS